MGMKTVLNMRKRVYTIVFPIKPLEYELGRVKLTILSTTNPNNVLVMALIATTAYCIPCEI